MGLKLYETLASCLDPRFSLVLKYRTTINGDGVEIHGKNPIKIQSFDIVNAVEGKTVLQRFFTMLTNGGKIRFPARIKLSPEEVAAAAEDDDDTATDEWRKLVQWEDEKAGEPFDCRFKLTAADVLHAALETFNHHVLSHKEAARINGDDTVDFYVEPMSRVMSVSAIDEYVDPYTIFGDLIRGKILITADIVNGCGEIIGIRNTRLKAVLDSIPVEILGREIYVKMLCNRIYTNALRDSEAYLYEDPEHPGDWIRLPSQSDI